MLKSLLLVKIYYLERIYNIDNCTLVTYNFFVYIDVI